MAEKMILGVNDKPKAGKWFALSFQHVFAMFGATVLVPMLTGLSVSVALFSSGVGTLIYILCTKKKVPVYLGSSFAYIAYINAAFAATGSTSFGAAMTGLVLVGIIYVIISIIIKFTGTKWLDNILPPVVVGPMIMVIGLGLATTAVKNAGMVAGGDYRIILAALFTMVLTACLAIKGKGFLKVIPFLIGIVGGYLFAVIIGFIPNGDFGQLVDFTNVVEVLKTPSQWFTLPDFMILGWKDAPLFANVKMIQINFAAAISVLPLAVVTICEHIGDHKVLGKITGEDYIKDPGLHRTLMGDGLATAFAGLIGGPANTSYGENTSVVGITKVASVWVTGGAAVLAILLSTFNVFTTLIETIPSAVMGGVCLILYGFIASNGLKTLFDSKVDMTQTRNLIIISVMLVIGIGGAVISYGIVSFSGMALSAIVGVILNKVLPRENKEKPEKEESI